MSIEEYLTEKFKSFLNEKYEAFKEELSNERFCPNAEAIWKMYNEIYKQNQGAYQFVKVLLGLEDYVGGHLNELNIALNETNRKCNDFCMAYVAALKKAGN